MAKEYVPPRPNSRLAGTTGIGLNSIPSIVAIDDESAHLQIVKIILSRESFPCELYLFDTADEGLAHLRDTPADLILLDLSMPEKDGFEVLGELRQGAVNRNTPVIFLSAYPDTEYMLRAFDMGATDYLHKPITSPIFTARIRAVLHTQDLQRELAHRNQALAETNRLKDEVLSVVSHDMRSPLTSIELICQFLDDVVQGKSDQSPALLINRILNQSRLARRLVENLLSLNKIEEGMLVAHPSFFSARDMLAACVEDQTPMLQARELTLDAELPAPEVLCFGDRELLSQVARNVLENAIKYARKTVRLVSAVQSAQEGRSGRLHLTIADDGPGIPPGIHQAIFDKYVQADGARRGSGLGLYISRKMMELHNGGISVDSAQGEGTTFHLELPNVYLPQELPDVSEIQESKVLVIYISSAVGQLLESVPVESGLVNVERLSLETATPELLERAGAAVAVLDVHGSAAEAIPLVRLIDESPSAIKWLLYGAKTDLQTFHKMVERQFEPLTHPIDPANYLNMLRELAAAPEPGPGLK